MTDKKYWRSKTLLSFMHLFALFYLQEEIRLHLRNTQINLAFRSVCTSISDRFADTEDRLHLRNTQINLVFHSVCTIFAADNTGC